MGLDFTRPAASPAPVQSQQGASLPAEQENYQQYDIVADRQQMNQRTGRRHP